MYLLDLYVPLGSLDTTWTFRYILDLWVPFGPLGTSWILRYLFDLYVHIGSLGALNCGCTFDKFNTHN